ncbi:MAG TPA: hypothetical protein VGQ83_00405 [Polyangia bacterium]|jgi:hypothetical protein
MKVLLVGPDLEENLALRCLSAALTTAGHTGTDRAPAAALRRRG